MSEQNETMLNEAEVMAAEAASSNQGTTTAPSIEDEDLRAIIESRVSEQVAEQKAAFKAKLDEVYAARDAIVAEKVALEEAKKAEEIRRLEDEGKHKEVADLRMAEMKAKLEAMTRENTRLTRDHAVKDAMRGLEFRSEIAGDMAYDRIVNQMVHGEDGRWTHKTGVSIREYIDHFAKDEDNSFLFKAKVNSGTGMSASLTSTNTSVDKPLNEMTTEEMLQHFAKQAPSGHGF